MWFFGKRNVCIKSNLSKFERIRKRSLQLDSFYFKIITILSLIFHDGKRICFCNKYRERINKYPERINYFWNYKNDLEKIRMDPIFMMCYRDKLFHFLCESYVMFEPSIAYFSGPFFRIYDSEWNIHQNVSLLDFDVLL